MFVYILYPTWLFLNGRKSNIHGMPPNWQNLESKFRLSGTIDHDILVRIADIVGENNQNSAWDDELIGVGIGLRKLPWRLHQRALSMASDLSSTSCKRAFRS